MAKRKNILWVLVVILGIGLAIGVFNRPDRPVSPGDVPVLQPVQITTAVIATQVQPQSTSRPENTAVPFATVQPTELQSGQPFATVKVDRVNVHSGPGLQYPIIERIERETVLRVLGINSDGTWLFILLPDNRSGWIQIEAVEMNVGVNSLPVVDVTAVPTRKPAETETPDKEKTKKPYGQGVLAPPDLRGMAPVSPGSPERSVLALVASWLLIVLVMIGAGAARLGVWAKRARYPVKSPVYWTGK